MISRKRRIFFFAKLECTTLVQEESRENSRKATLAPDGLKPQEVGIIEGKDLDWGSDPDPGDMRVTRTWDIVIRKSKTEKGKQGQMQVPCHGVGVDYVDYCG
jgi:hypothetical protein